MPRVAEQTEIAAFIREKDVEFRPLFAQIERKIATLTACGQAADSRVRHRPAADH